MTSLLLIHGALGATAQVSPLANALANEYDVHCVELRGHGDSPPAGEFGIESFA